MTALSQQPRTDRKRDIQSFWGDVYQTAYAEHDAELDLESLDAALDDLEDMFHLRGHLAVVEIDLTSLQDKKLLEVGSGAGGHSALFARHGAKVTSVDITFQRTQATRTKLALIGDTAGAGQASQADAELLPFPADTFDIVYSNGVLHHTDDTVQAINEVHRVLKPGGRAVIMLYCKSSIHYWFTLLLCVGILKGGLLRGHDWLGHATEWIGPAHQTSINPITKCYFAGGIRRLFQNFADVELRKSDFSAGNIPKLGRLVRRWQSKRYGSHPGGHLVYGGPWLITSPIEQQVGRLAGWAWNIQATKPAAT